MLVALVARIDNFYWLALLVPAGLFGIAFTGRLLSAIVDGTYPQFWLPMLVEAAMVVISLMASRLLPHRAVGHAAHE